MGQGPVETAQHKTIQRLLSTLGVGIDVNDVQTGPERSSDDNHDQCPEWRRPKHHRPFQAAPIAADLTGRQQSKTGQIDADTDEGARCPDRLRQQQGHPIGEHQQGQQQQRCDPGTTDGETNHRNRDDQENSEHITRGGVPPVVPEQSCVVGQIETDHPEELIKRRECPPSLRVTAQITRQQNQPAVEQQ